MNPLGIIFDFNGFLFEGLRFIRYKKSSDQYYYGLIDKMTAYSKVKYIDSLSEDLEEQIHIKLSWSFAFEFFAILFLIVTFILILNSFTWYSVGTVCLSIFLHLLFLKFKNIAFELVVTRKMIKTFADFIFNKI